MSDVSRDDYPEGIDVRQAKTSFVMHTDLKTVLDKLTDEQAGKVFKAIYEWHCGDSENAANGLDFALEMVMIPLINQFKRDRDKWMDIRAKRSESGKLGGRPKGSKAKKAKAFSEKQKKQSKAKKAVDVDVDVDVGVDVDVDVGVGVGVDAGVPEDVNKPTNTSACAEGVDGFKNRISAIFNRKPTTKWSPKELKRLKEIDPSEEDMKAIEGFYALRSKSAADVNFWKSDLYTLLNQWNDQLDRARNPQVLDRIRNGGGQLKFKSVESHPSPPMMRREG